MSTEDALESRTRQRNWGIAGMAVELGPSGLILAIICGFAVVFPLVWCLVLTILSLAGGWRRLALHYAAGARPVTGEPRKLAYGMVGLVSYRFVLTLHVASDGFFMEVPAVFRILHPRLFIPWGEISARAPRALAWWGAETFSIGKPTVAKITLPENALPDPLPLG